MARRKGWLSRISSQVLGDRMARVLDMYYDLVEAVDSPDEFTQRHLPIAACTCLELFYRQVGRRVFDPKMHMHTAVNLSITPADLPELARIVSLLAPATCSGSTGEFRASPTSSRRSTIWACRARSRGTSCCSTTRT